MSNGIPHKSSLAAYRIPQGLDHKERIVSGEEPGLSKISKFGRHEGVAAVEVLAAYNGVYGLPAEADYVEAVSTSLADVPEGAGAWAVLVHGVGEGFVKQEEIILMGAQSVKKYLRVSIARVLLAGGIGPVGGGNVGDITLQQVGGTPMVVIPENEGSTLCGCYTIPAGHYALVSYADTTTGAGKSSLNRFKIRKTYIPNAPFTTEGIRDNFENQVGRVFTMPTRVDEKTDLVFTSISESAGAAISVTVIIELREKKYGYE